MPGNRVTSSSSLGVWVPACIVIGLTLHCMVYSVQETTGVQETTDDEALGPLRRLALPGARGPLAPDPAGGPGRPHAADRARGRRRRGRARRREELPAPAAQDLHAE